MRTAKIVGAVLLLVATAGGAAAVWWLPRYIEQRAKGRVVRSEGALLAMNDTGLLELSRAYGVPKACGDMNFMRRDFDAWMHMCSKGLISKPDSKKPGLTWLPGGTNADSVEHRYVFESGALAPPSYFPQTLSQRRSDGALAIERIRVTEGPNKGLTGWIATEAMQRTFGPFL